MDKNLNNKIEKLIQEGNLIRKNNTVKSSLGEYISGGEYELWVTKCVDLMETHFKDHHLKFKLKVASQRAVGNSPKYYDEIISVLKILVDTDKFLELINPIEFQISDLKNCNKIFISHSSKDIDYVEELISLLNAIGIAKSRENIFCSSLEGYNIPSGVKLYDYIKNELSESAFVILVLSKNYYESIACLNEMGAVWITAKSYVSILLPEFSFNLVEGAIDPTEISFKINDKQRINSFKTDITNIFKLPDIDFSIWERDRDNFLSKINELASRDKYSNSETKVDIGKIKKIANNKLSLELRFINNKDIPVEFTDLTFKLIDADDNTFEYQIPYSDLQKYIIYGFENRREVIEVDFQDTLYNPLKHKKWNTSSFTSPAF